MNKRVEEHEEDEISLLRGQLKKGQRRQNWVVGLLVGLVLLSNVANLGFSEAIYNQNSKKSLTIAALETFAKNGNCNDVRTQAFETMILVYLDSSDRAEREHAKAVYKAIKACPVITIKGVK